MAAKHWMQPVAKKIKKSGHSGVFREAATRHGMSTHAYAEKEKHASGTVGQRARLALAYMSAKRG
jgi:hypothetical protein